MCLKPLILLEPCSSTQTSTPTLPSHDCSSFTVEPVSTCSGRVGVCVMCLSLCAGVYVMCLSVCVQVFGQQSQQGVSGCTDTSCPWICTPRPDGRHRCLCPDGLHGTGDKCTCPGGGTPLANATCPPGETRHSRPASRGAGRVEWPEALPLSHAGDDVLAVDMLLVIGRRLEGW